MPWRLLNLFDLRLIKILLRFKDCPFRAHLIGLNYWWEEKETFNISDDKDKARVNYEFCIFNK